MVFKRTDYRDSSYAGNIIMRPFLFLCALLSISLLAAPAWAEKHRQVSPAAAQAVTRPGMREKIAVVVNDSAITGGDVAARYAMALLSAGLRDSPEIRSRLIPQVIRTLIDEQIQMQEARRQQVSIAQEDIDRALNKIAQDNNIPGGDMRKFLRSHGVPPETLEAQARANLGWLKLVERTLRPSVEIGEDEIEETIARLRDNAGKQEYFVNEIYLPFDDPGQETTVAQFAGNLLGQIKKTGAFGAIARQFSQGAGALNGGEIGWVQQGMLTPEIDRALEAGKKGDLLGPIRTSNGYRIIAIRDIRRIEGGGPRSANVKLAQLTLPFTPARGKEAALAEAGKLRSTIKGCADLAQKFDAKSGWSVLLMDTMPAVKLPSWLGTMALTQKVGIAGMPFASGNAAALVVVCERIETGGPDRESITNRIGAERLENMARRMLRDLKRNAYIDVRI